MSNLKNHYYLYDLAVTPPSGLRPCTDTVLLSSDKFHCFLAFSHSNNNDNDNIQEITFYFTKTNC